MSLDQDRQLVLALCALSQLPHADEEFVHDVSVLVLDQHQQLSPAEMKRALALLEKHQ